MSIKLAKNLLRRLKKNHTLNNQIARNALPNLEQLEDRTLFSLLGFSLDLPVITYNAGGTLDYDASSQALTIDATPQLFIEDGTSTPPFPMITNGAMTMDIQVDNAGVLVGGSAGSDFEVSGDLDIDGDNIVDFSGVLISGEIAAFGFQDNGFSGTGTPIADAFDFRFNLTGGELASYFTGGGIGVTLTGENIGGVPGFEDFTQDFQTVAKGNIGGVLGTGDVFASLGDYVWNDTNFDGIQDDDESGVEGVTVTLTGGGADGVIGTGGDDTTAVTTTDGTGFYEFLNLNPGEEYKVTFSDLPANTAFTKQNEGDDTLDSDADPANGMTQIVTLGAGEHNPTLDAGIVELAGLGDYVWNDVNVNGLQDDGEAPFEGVVLNLLNEDGVAVGTTTTDGTGYYEFVGLLPGKYSVEVDSSNFDMGGVLDGYVATLQDVNGNGNDADDSDGDRDTNISHQVMLMAGDFDPTIDFGFFTASIDVEKYVKAHDCPPGEGNGGEGLTPGYWKQSHHFDDWTNYSPNDNYNDVFGVDDYSGLTLHDALRRGGGEHKALGRHAVAALLNANSGFVDYDLSESEIISLVQNAYATGEFQDAKNILVGFNEQGADRDPVASGNTTTVVETRVIDFDTDANGNAIARGTVIDDEYADWGVTISSHNMHDHPSMIFDTENPTGGDWDLATPGYHSTNTTPLGNVLIISEDGKSYDPDDNYRGGDLKFKFDKEVRVDSVSLLDIDRGESGGKIKLFDADNNLIKMVNIPGTGDNSTQTIDIDTDGVAKMIVWLESSGAVSGVEYSCITEVEKECEDFDFDNLGADADELPGETFNVGDEIQFNYVVTNDGEVDLENVDLWDDNATPGDDSDDFAPDAVLNENGFNIGDVNEDGILNVGESWAYVAFATMGEGHYVNVADVSANVVDDPDTIVFDDDPANYHSEQALLGSIGDKVWKDLDGDGIQDDGEWGVEGVTVNLLDADMNIIETVTTDEDGMYLFDELEAGDYYVQFVELDGYDFTDQDSGNDDNVDSDAGNDGKTDLIELAAGEHIDDVDAGLVRESKDCDGRKTKRRYSKDSKCRKDYDRKKKCGDYSSRKSKDYSNCYSRWSSYRSNYYRGCW